MGTTLTCWTHRLRPQMSDCCWKTPDHFFNTRSASTHIFPYQQSHQWGVLHLQKLMCNTFKLFCNQAQLLPSTNRVDEVTFHEGWSHSVAEEQQYLCSTVGGEIWDHNTLKLKQWIFNRPKNSRDLPNDTHTRPSSRHYVLSWGFGVPPCLSWQSCMGNDLGNDFKVWISSIGLVTQSSCALVLPALATHLPFHMLLHFSTAKLPNLLYSNLVWNTGCPDFLPRKSGSWSG